MLVVGARFQRQIVPAYAFAHAAKNVMSDRSVSPPLHRTTWISQLSAEAYIGARVVFALSYWLKIPVVRSLAWLVGMVCCGAVPVLAVVPIT